MHGVRDRKHRGRVHRGATIGRRNRHVRRMARIKPRGPRRTGASWVKVAVERRLEDDLGHELNVAGFAGADSRSTVEGANQVGHHSESGRTEIRRASVGREVLGADVPVGRIGSESGYRPHSGSQVDAVEEVEEIRAELDLDALGNRNVLDE